VVFDVAVLRNIRRYDCSHKVQWHQLRLALPCLLGCALLLRVGIEANAWYGVTCNVRGWNDSASRRLKQGCTGEW